MCNRATATAWGTHGVGGRIREGGRKRGREEDREGGRGERDGRRGRGERWTVVEGRERGGWREVEGRGQKGFNISDWN